MQRENGYESSTSMMKGEQEDLSESGCEDEGPEEEKHDEQEESEQEEGQDGKDEQGTGQEVPADLKRVTMNPDEAETMSLEPFDPSFGDWIPKRIPNCLSMLMRRRMSAKEMRRKTCHTWKIW